MIVGRIITFDAAHHLPYHEGKCKNMHGHHWKVELAVEGPIQHDGMVMDFSILNAFLQQKVHARFDHTTLNDTIENPTAENLCLFIRNEWSKHEAVGIKLHHIRVWETENSFAVLS